MGARRHVYFSTALREDHPFRQTTGVAQEDVCNATIAKVRTFGDVSSTFVAFTISGNPVDWHGWSLEKALGAIELSNELPTAPAIRRLCRTLQPLRYTPNASAEGDRLPNRTWQPEIA